MLAKYFIYVNKDSNKLHIQQEGDPGTKECRYFSTVEDALDAYTALYTQQTQAPYSLTRAESVLSHKIGSDKMIQVCTQKYFLYFPY